MYVLDVKELSKNPSCSPNTNHNYAYRYYFSECVENNRNLVASGYCRQMTTMVYISGTFNDGAGRSYTDQQFYGTNDNRKMSPIEQRYFDYCFNDWKTRSYETGYVCDLSSTTLDMLNQADSPQNLATCGGQRHIVSIALIITGLIVIFTFRK